MNNVMRQFDNAADIIDLNPNIRKILEVTNNELVVHFPVRMDNGEVEVFTGYRVQHNNSLGPYKGGLRYHPTVDIDAARALAMWMTWKTSLARLPYGGAKGGIQLDPQKYSQAGAGTHNPALYLCLGRQHRTGTRYSRTRCKHQCPNHGLDIGYLYVDQIADRTFDQHARGDR